MKDAMVTKGIRKPLDRSTEKFPVFRKGGNNDNRMWAGKNKV